MDKHPSGRNRRLAFVISGILDTLIGTAFLLLGSGILPMDVTDYGFENWHALTVGGLIFLFGIAVLAYNLSRMEEE